MTPNIKERKKFNFKEYQKEWYEKNKERVKQRMRDYYKKNRKRENAKRMKHYKENKRKVFDRMNERRKSDKEYAFKCAIRIKHNNYVRYNFERADCEKCKGGFEIKDIEIHHGNWNLPDVYNLLCKPCHAKIHKRELTLNA